MEKRSFLAFALALAVLAFYPMLVKKMYPDAYRQKPLTASARAIAAPGKPILTDSSSAADLFQPSEDRTFSDRKLKIAFNKKGGAIRQIEFLDFTDPEKKQPIRFFSLDSPAGAPTAIDLADAGGVTAEYDLREEDDGFTATAQLTPTLKVTKRFVFRDGGYAADLGVTFENTADKPLALRYRMDVGSRIPARESIDGQYLEANFFSTADGKRSLRHIKEHKPGKIVESASTVDWVAVKDRHFSVIVKPSSPVAYTGLVRGLGNKQFSASLVSAPVMVPPHESVRHDFLVYAGPNDIDILLPLGLDPLVNFGKLDMIGKLLVGCLEMLRGVFRNYGAAIIVLTLSINVLLFPFTRVSYMSMKRMQLIQPQMNKLKEQHKKNPDKLNREMMELYKKHKVNPFGGCLPMLIQMPVFMALYVALSKTVGLRNASFLWIRDLSSPDAVYLPFSIPVFGHEIHVLPLVMVGAMVVQQRFTQIKMDGQDPNMEAQQKMMSVMMPVLFGFIFYSMPSGLVLYWLTNTLLMSAYQLHLKKVTLT